MNPIDITLTKWKVIGAFFTLLTLIAMAAAGGAVVNGWRMDAAGQRAISAERSNYAALLLRHNDLLLKNERQNGSISLLAYKTEVAVARRAQAERWAAGAVQSGERRIADIKASTAASCDGVLREAWEKR